MRFKSSHALTHFQSKQPCVVGAAAARTCAHESSKEKAEIVFSVHQNNFACSWACLILLTYVEGFRCLTLPKLYLQNTGWQELPPLHGFCVATPETDAFIIDAIHARPSHEAYMPSCTGAGRL